MKRNMELVRHILMETENAEKGIQLLDLVTGQWDSEAIAYHVELMAAHGLLDAQVTRSASGRAIHGNIQGLTWDGRDYLDAIRDDRVWRKTMQGVKEAVGSTTLDVIKSVAVAVGTQAIMTRLGM